MLKAENHIFIYLFWSFLDFGLPEFSHSIMQRVFPDRYMYYNLQLQHYNFLEAFWRVCCEIVSLWMKQNKHLNWLFFFTLVVYVPIHNLNNLSISVT